jgi:predicted DNA-binding protein (MmcQ/YjbR family)
MTFSELRAYCASKHGAEETFPFGETVLVFKVAGKMFALTGLDTLPLSVNLKCDPDRAIELRERYAAVQPGYHMSKVHWNTVELDGSVPAREIRSWIDDSYDLVVKSLKPAARDALRQLKQ